MNADTHTHTYKSSPSHGISISSGLSNVPNTSKGLLCALLAIFSQTHQDHQPLTHQATATERQTSRSKLGATPRTRATQDTFSAPRLTFAQPHKGFVHGPALLVAHFANAQCIPAFKDWAWLD